MFAAFTELACQGSGLACPAGRVTLTHQELPDQGDLLSQPERDTNYLAADGEARPAADCAAGTPTLQGAEQEACRHHLHLSFVSGHPSCQPASAELGHARSLVLSGLRSHAAVELSRDRRLRAAGPGTVSI